jgi:hypothetical protein
MHYYNQLLERTLTLTPNPEVWAGAIRSLLKWAFAALPHDVRHTHMHT